MRNPQPNGLRLDTLERARTTFDVATADLRLQIHLARWHGLPLCAIAAAAGMSSAACARFMHAQAPCGAAGTVPPDCPLRRHVAHAAPAPVAHSR